MSSDELTWTRPPEVTRRASDPGKLNAFAALPLNVDRWMWTVAPVTNTAGGGPSEQKHGPDSDAATLTSARTTRVSAPLTASVGLAGREKEKKGRAVNPIRST